jgi:hypothetical protein
VPLIDVRKGGMVVEAHWQEGVPVYVNDLVLAILELLKYHAR